MTNQVADALGYVGAGLIVLTYFLNQSGRLASDDWRYPALNLLGSALITISLLVHTNAPSLVIEVFWAAISMYGLARSWRRRARRPGN